MNRNKFKLCSISCIIYLPWYHYLAFFNLNWYFSMFSYIFSEKVVVECFARGRGIVILGKDSFEISHLLRKHLRILGMEVGKQEWDTDDSVECRFMQTSGCFPIFSTCIETFADIFAYVTPVMKLSWSSETF